MRIDPSSPRPRAAYLAAALASVLATSPLDAQERIGVEVRFAGEAENRTLAPRARAALTSYFDHSPSRPARDSDENALVEGVTAALFGPPSARPDGFAPSEQNLASIRESVREYIRAGAPIEGVTFWGGARNYGQRGAHPRPPGGPELADALALRRYEQIHRAVQEAGYAPGIRPRLVVEDLGRRFMGSDTEEMARSVAEYTAGLRHLVDVVAPNVVVEPESEIIAGREMPERARQLLNLPAGSRGSERAFFEVAKMVEERIYRYLRASERVAPRDQNDVRGFEAVSQLPEFTELEAIGFRGGIPLAQRNYIRRSTRMRLGNPARISADELDRHVAKYFAQGCTRAMFDVRRGTTSTGHQPLQPLSLSFLPYPPRNAFVTRCPADRMEGHQRHRRKRSNGLGRRRSVCTARTSARDYRRSILPPRTSRSSNPRRGNVHPRKPNRHRPDELPADART